MTSERQACTAVTLKEKCLNANCNLPYGLKPLHVYKAMQDFTAFLSFINEQLYSKGMSRLESFLMPANFSSIVGEFMNMSIPKYCSGLVKNQFHNGHPDLIPANQFHGNSIQYAHDGLEVKGSRHLSGWQGHNPESVWLMVFCFGSNTSADTKKKIGPKSFQFHAVYAAKLEESDWNFSGRSGTSRRTITASINKTGVTKMKNNWVYEDLT